MEDIIIHKILSDLWELLLYMYLDSESTLPRTTVYTVCTDVIEDLHPD